MAQLVDHDDHDDHDDQSDRPHYVVYETGLRIPCCGRRTGAVEGCKEPRSG